jgi:hypothetical protein
MISLDLPLLTSLSIEDNDIKVVNLNTPNLEYICCDIGFDSAIIKGSKESVTFSFAKVSYIEVWREDQLKNQS